VAAVVVAADTVAAVMVAVATNIASVKPLMNYVYFTVHIL
jgi:hypothetical protein